MAHFSTESISAFVHITNMECHVRIFVDNDAFKVNNPTERRITANIKGNSNI